MIDIETIRLIREIASVVWCILFTLIFLLGFEIGKFLGGLREK